ncbi:ion transporter [Tenacibaculum piscium]|uniref:Voltage-gated potassium channel n=1 Tax=Tenacibaculum piscium TaxID=1458515 RepID=A0A2H1YJ74_9FLAO|nr:ion transporter [Tenacibaculum piscium]MBE7628651.1 ion transporter [Tenacibaculum piscium]MBE7669792.1 ion transporter [Tenacibaculum piscium]MBE7684620.1 ion transporter [Tenacibaculum piscium]MBE7689240.1 ion transporter [Tenacibaculum piscium]SOS75441.1 Voltage-gated potassium channel [Tenacibaculum piscium]
MKEKLRNIIENNTSKEGKVFDYFIQVLILLSLIAFTVETLPNNSNTTINFLNIFETTCIIIFSIEYILRILISKKPLKYIFSFYGIIDFLAIFPYYIKGIFDLRTLRMFRIFRVFRALKLIRYNKALNRFHIAAKIVKEEMVLFFIVTFIFVFLAASGIYFFENEAQPESFKSIIHSGWWAIATLTTVGYGDVYPITVGGKIFTFFILLVGVGVVTVPAGLVASALAKAREIEKENNEVE